MSVSQYKDFCDCEARAVAKLTGEFVPEMTTALLVGSYVDAWFEGTLELFAIQHPEIFKRDGTLREGYEKANEIIQRVQQDKLFMEYMSGEKQVIRTAEMFGTLWKIKIDSHHYNKIVDLKVMRSLERIMGVSFVEHWGYDIQMAVYSEIEYRSAVCSHPNDRLETYLAVATKEPVTDLDIIHIPEWRRQECLKEIETRMPRILAVKRGQATPERCGVCEYCRQTKVLTEPVDFELVGYSTKEIKAMRGEL